jgi:hypothetical protein
MRRRRIQSAAVLNERVAQEGSFRECSVVQSRQVAVGSDEVKSAGAPASAEVASLSSKRQRWEIALERDIFNRKDVGSCMQRAAALGA